MRDAQIIPRVVEYFVSGTVQEVNYAATKDALITSVVEEFSSSMAQL
jgi:hypothetical protein